MVVEKLQKFGLSEKEARVYAALQRLGTSVASTIARNSGINRSTAYVLLESLARRGLVRALERGGVRAYSPASAERFVEMAESSLAKSSSLVEASRELLAEFKKESRETPAKPTIQFFAGTEGIKTAYEVLLTPKESIFSYSALNMMYETLPDFFPDYRRRQVTKNIRVRTVATDTPLNRKIIANDNESSCEYFLAQASNSASDFIITRSKVAFVSFTELSSFIIEDAAFATLHKTMFDTLLTQTRRFNVKPETMKAKSHGKHRALVKATRRFFSV